MPVSFSPAKHAAVPVQYAEGSTRRGTPLTLLQSACPKHYQKCDEILQHSFSDFDFQGREPVLPKSNGLVDAVSDAYNTHHALSIRPDDVWIAILTQFSCFVNANAEQLRSSFVKHEGKKELKVTASGTRYTVDFGGMAVQMTGQLKENLSDPALCDWILPKFSTTTPNDTVVSSIVMMATMKKYFTYVFELRCGIPRVTLEGEKSDWEELVKRIEKLKDYGAETTAWYHLLLPVLSRFVRAFDDPDAAENLDFWQKVCHRSGGGSGPTYFSGWLTAFCVFDADGKWLGNKLGPDNTITNLISTGFGRRKPLSNLVLDGAHYHVLKTSDIPSAYADVDVKLDDNGELFETMMVAGLVGARVCNSGDAKLSKTGTGDLLKPVAGWWMFIKKEEDR